MLLQVDTLGVERLTSDNLDSVRDEKKPVVIIAWSSICAACSAMWMISMPEILRERGRQYRFLHVELLTQTEFFEYMGIEAFPSYLICLEGKIVAKFSGMMPPNDFMAKLDGILPAKSIKESKMQSIASSIASGIKRILVRTTKSSAE